MSQFLDNINEPKDLEKLNYDQKDELAKELRDYVIKVVSETGGHLASNLGVVELTIALHSVFDGKKDKIIWDVGHQTYIHKILTGRKEKMNTLRQLNGISGFPKTNESEYDSFNTGHSSTSISVAMGMARARDIMKEDYSVVAVIGDGALTGGMALEALNDAGSSNKDIIVILNDNEMSISKNVGGLSRFLGYMRRKRFYTQSNKKIKKIVRKIPKIGEKLIHLTRRVKYGIKQLFISNMFFENIGFTYLGPMEGHDIEKIESMLKMAKKIGGPVLIHLVTKKGKGYKPAEDDPERFHGTSSFDIQTGNPKKQKEIDYSKVFSEKIVELAKKDERIVAVTAAMASGTGLKEFKKEFPERFFDVGIAEQHALGMCAGLAKSGLKPIISLYSSFYQRGYDQVIHDIAIQKLPVVMCVDRAGIVGNDGETHQGQFDMAFFQIVPNITIMAPKDFEELKQMLEYAFKLNKPVVIRYPRGGEGNTKFIMHSQIAEGKAEVIKYGNDVSIIGIGKMVEKAKEVAELLKIDNIDAEVVNVRFLKPIDEKQIIESINKTKKVVTIEDGTIVGGLYSKICEIANKYNINKHILGFAYPDEFIRHGSVVELEKLYGLDSSNIYKKVRESL